MNSETETIQRQISDLKQKLVAARRKASPQPIRDYDLKDAEGKPVRLSDLFAGKSELMVIHNMGKRCPYCTLWADGFSGVADHLANRAPFVLSSPDDPRTLKEFATSRGWRFRAVSIHGTSFAKDLGFEKETGQFQPGVSTFTKSGDKIARVAFDSFGPGDDYCALWHLLDLLPQGKGDWEPKYSYKP